MTSKVGDVSGSSNAASASLSWATVGTLAAGDLAILFWAMSTSVSPTAAPSGFTIAPGTWPQEDSNLRVYVYTKVLTGSESGSLSLNLDATTRQTAVMIVLRGFDVPTVYSIKAEAGTSASHTFNTLTFTGTAAILAVSMERGTPPATAVTTVSSGYTIEEQLTNGTSGGTFVAVASKTGSITTPVTSTQTPGTWTNDTSVSNQLSIGVAVPPTAAGITQALPVATETDAGQATARKKTYALPITTGTNTAQALGRAKTRSDPIAAETEAAQTLTRRKTLPLPTAVETNTAQTPGRVRGHPLPLIGELLRNNDFEQGITPWGSNNYLGFATVATSVTQSSEQAHSGTYSAKAVWPSTASQGSNINSGSGSPTNLKNGQSYTYRCWVYVPTGSPDVRACFALRAQAALVSTKDAWTLSTVTWVADTLTASVGIDTVEGVGLTGGTVAYMDDASCTLTGVTAPRDTAVPLGRTKTKALPTAVETDSATAPGRVRSRALAATETDTAQTLARVKSRPLAATETDTALTLTSGRPVPLPTATGTDAARTLGRSRSRTLPVATGTDLAQTLGRIRTLALARPAETDLARVIVRFVVGGLVIAQETDAARALTRRHSYSGLSGVTLDDAMALNRTKTKALPVAVETQTSRPLTRVRGYTLFPAIETDLARRPGGTGVTRTQRLPIANNLISNPFIETTTSPWTTGDYFGTRAPADAIEQSAEQVYSGASSLKASWPETVSQPSDVFENLTGFINKERYVFSFWVYVPTGSPDIRAGIALVTAGAYTSVKDAWTEVRVLFAATGTSHSPAIETALGPIPEGSVAYADDFYLGAMNEKAQLFGRKKTRLLPTAVETDSTQRFGGGRHSFPIATGTQTAVPLTRSKSRLLPTAVEADLSRAIGKKVARHLPIALESEGARTITRAGAPVGTAQWYVSDNGTWVLCEVWTSDGTTWKKAAGAKVSNTGAWV